MLRWLLRRLSGLLLYAALHKGLAELRRLMQVLRSACCHRQWLA
jgi:hypothetical protein